LVGLIYGILFLLCGILDAFNGNYANSFVLFTISAVFFKGFIIKKESYYIGGAIIASIFGILSLIVLASTYVDTFLNEEASFKFSYGLFGILALPYLFMVKKIYSKSK